MNRIVYGINGTKISPGSNLPSISGAHTLVDLDTRKELETRAKQFISSYFYRASYSYADDDASLFC